MKTYIIVLAMVFGLLFTPKVYSNDVFKTTEFMVMVDTVMPATELRALQATCNRVFGTFAENTLYVRFRLPEKWEPYSEWAWDSVSWNMLAMTMRDHNALVLAGQNRIKVLGTLIQNNRVLYISANPMDSTILQLPVITKGIVVNLGVLQAAAVATPKNNFIGWFKGLYESARSPEWFIFGASEAEVRNWLTAHLSFLSVLKLTDTKCSIIYPGGNQPKPFNQGE